FHLAQVEIKNANWVDRALDNFKEAARLEPRNKSYLREAARSLYEHGSTDDAEIFARRLVSVDPSPENNELLHSISAKARVLPARAEEPSPPPVVASPGEVEIGALPPEPSPEPAGRERPSLLSRLFRHRT